MVVLKRIRCPECNSADVRATVEGTFFCRHCGYKFKRERVDLRVDRKESEEKVKRIEF